MSNTPNTLALTVLQQPSSEPRGDEYGFRRTKCGCKLCGLGCRFTPGMLSPADVPRIARHLGYLNLENFARDNLLASAGAKLATMTPAGIKFYRVPTLVPARQENGSCKFLVDGRCSIHEVSPYGCAYFDSHQNDAQHQERSLAVHTHIEREHATNGPYAQLWNMLKAEGRIGIPPEALKAKWAEAERKNRPTAHAPKKDRNKPKRR